GVPRVEPRGIAYDHARGAGAEDRGRPGGPPEGPAAPDAAGRRGPDLGRRRQGRAGARVARRGGHRPRPLALPRVVPRAGGWPAMNIAVVGTGYVGLVTGACFAEFGNHVTCVDKDRDKIDRLLRGEIPIYEPGLEDLVQRNVKAGRLEFTTDVPKAVREALVVFIAVGTPQGNDGRADLSFVKDVAKAVAENLNAFKVVVTKSTVPA